MNGRLNKQRKEQSHELGSSSGGVIIRHSGGGVFSKYVRRHLSEKKHFEKEKILLFRYLLQYHILSLHLMIQGNLHRGTDLGSKTLFGIDSSNLYLFALKLQKQRIRAKLLLFLGELNFYSEVLKELDSSHVSANSTLMTQFEQKMKVHEIMTTTCAQPPEYTWKN